MGDAAELGTQVSRSPSTSSSTYEQKDFVLLWDEGKRPWCSTDQNSPYQSESAARMYFWNGQQQHILPSIQSWLDDGWEPVTEVGPAGFELRYFRHWVLGIVGKIICALLFLSVVGFILGLLWLYIFVNPRVEVVEFRVNMRRQIR